MTTIPNYILNIAFLCCGSIGGILGTIVFVVWYVQRIPRLNKIIDKTK